MTSKLLFAASSAAIAVALSAAPAAAGYSVPGETMGVSLDSPLPEGVFFADLETYGRADKQPDANIGVNIPIILWSTPWSFYNTRLEFLAGFPFAHIDAATGSAATDAFLNHTGAITFALGPILAHDFGNGLTGGISAFVRTPSPSSDLQAIDGRTTTEGDFRESLQYTFGAGSALSGITLIENGGVTTALGQPGFVTVNDMFFGDFTIEKTFDKLTVGFTGFGNADLDNRIGAGGQQASVELGGLIGYDFGKFSLTGIVTRTVYENAVGRSDTLAGVVSGNGYETRGWVRVIVPLYVAPSAPVVARY